MDGIVIAARTGALVMFGIEPTRAETGYGYIKRGEAIPSRLAHRVEGFVQKPQADVAQGLFESRHYLWNSGMYVFPVGRFVQLLEGYRPDLHGPLSKLFIVAGRNLAGDLSKVSADYETTSANSRQLLGYVETSVGGIDRVGSFAENVAGDMGGLTEMQVMTTTQVDRPDESSSEYVNALIDAFYKGDVPVVSLDHAVMIDAARDGHVVVILLETGWSDVGLWESVRDLYLAGKIIPPPDVVRILRSRFGIPDEDEPSNP
jgi:mannose-1-phosphate guanylyltransferase